MFFNIPSILFNHSDHLSVDDLNRTDRIAVAIELLTSCIFIALYISRLRANFPKNKKSYKHLTSSILFCKSCVIRVLLSNVELNAIESNTINRLSDLLNSILYKNNIDRYIQSKDQIFASLDQSSFSANLVQSVKREIQFVLAIANQLDYTDDVIVIPYIRSFTSHEAFNKDTMTLTDVRFDLRVDQTKNNASDLWYRIYQGVKFFGSREDVIKIFQHLCLAINIGILPDLESGLGINLFPFESFYVSDTLKKYISETDINSIEKHISIFDYETVFNAILLNNQVLKETHSAAMEADFTDQVGESEEPTDGNEEDQQVDDSLDTGEEDPSSEEPEADASTDDTQVDAMTNTDNSENNSSTDDLNNQEQTEKKLLGFDVKLVVNETLDNFMYKVSVAKFVDNLIKFNHDDVPSESVAILRKWKNSLLFLTDAEETKRLLKSLKITLK